MENFSFLDLEIPFDKEHKIIAVSLSGGADSALLCYLLCDYIKQNNLDTKVIIINMIRNWKTKPYAGPAAKRVIATLQNSFPNIITKVFHPFMPPELEHGVIGNIIGNASADNIFSRSFIDYIFATENASAVYTGLTSNPPVNLDTNDKMESRDDHKSLEQVFLKTDSGIIIKPFVFVDKSFIIKCYKELGLFNLLKQTRSCEGYKSHINYFTYENYPDTVCGECFWCKERAWALKENGLDDKI